MLASFGMDPEYVLMRGEIPISALPILKGRKQSITPLRFGGISADNVNMEYCVNPSTDKEEVINNFREVIKESIPLLQDTEPHAIASTIFPRTELQSPEALAFGCDPDHNPYTMDLNRIQSGQTRLRSAGGHIHLGSMSLDEDFILTQEGLVNTIRAMDLFLGIPFVWLDRDPTSPQRRKLYGVAGAYRTTSYGLEYRTLSNYWTRTPELFSLAFDLSQHALQFSKDHQSIDLISIVGMDEFQKMINKSNVNLCREFFYAEIAPFTPEGILDQIESLGQGDVPRTSMLQNWC